MAFLCINHIYDHRKIHKEYTFGLFIYLISYCWYDGEDELCGGVG